MKTVLSFGQPSWRFKSDKVNATITRLGGHLAPVEFQLGKKTVAPYAIAPWAEEKTSPGLPKMLQALRGDFFCAPFGGNDEAWKGEKHPAHGETANAIWKFESLEQKDRDVALHLSLKTRIRKGRVDKVLFLRKGETAIYSRHILSGMSGRMNIGHHATLKFPEGEGSGQISTSRFQSGQVLPVPFEDPAQGGYNSLKAGATFKRIDQVPKADGTMADLSRYPARRGFEDLVMLTHRDHADFAWSAVAFAKEGYAWFALKDPRVLQSTVFWMSNGGRHYAPWNGRHVDVMGIEDVTAYFHCGLAPSLKANAVNGRGVATSLPLYPEFPLVVNYIMAVAAIPRGFEKVKSITPEKDGVMLQATSGQKIFAPLDLSFLYETNL